MAVVRKAGWEVDADTGAEVFRVVVDYQKDDEPPRFPINVVWKNTPVKIVLINDDA